MLKRIFQNQEKILGIVLEFLYSLVGSFFITSIAILIGYINTNGYEVYISAQLIFSNFVFDILTIFISIRLIEFLVKQKNLKLLIPIFIIDIVLALSFACLSVYFGFFGTENQISMNEICQLAIRNPLFIFDSEEYDYYFMLMHTCFIPTIIYLILITLMYISKIVLRFSEYLLIPRSETKRAYGLCRSFFLVLAGIGALLKLI